MSNPSGDSTGRYSPGLYLQGATATTPPVGFTWGDRPTKSPLDPTHTPTCEPAYHINTTTGRIWWYYDGEWH